MSAIRNERKDKASGSGGVRPRYPRAQGRSREMSRRVEEGRGSVGRGFVPPVVGGSGAAAETDATAGDDLVVAELPVGSTGGEVDAVAVAAAATVVVTAGALVIAGVVGPVAGVAS